MFGGSWGSTLGLAYAETHPQRVTELVLRGVFTARQSEIDWVFCGLIARVHPEAWLRLVEPLDRDAEPWDHESKPSRTLLARYGELLADPDPSIQARAAVAWATSEAMCLAVHPRAGEISALEDPAEAYPTARIEHHYFAHNAWLDQDRLIDGAATLADIPTVIVQGRYDMLTPTITAVELHRALPTADLIIVEDAGHAFDELGIVDALVRVTNRFADPRRHPTC